MSEIFAKARSKASAEKLGYQKLLILAKKKLIFLGIFYL